MEMKKRAAPVWRQGLVGAGFSYASMLILTAVAAWFLGAELVGERWMNYLAAGILLLAAFAGAWAAKGSAPVVNTFICAGVFWLGLVMLSIMVFDGNLAGASASALPIFGGSGSALLLPDAGRRKRSGRPRRRRR